MFASNPEGLNSCAGETLVSPEVWLLPPPETDGSRCLRQVVLEIRRRREVRLGLPEPEDVPAHALPPETMLAEMIMAGRRRQLVSPRNNGTNTP